MAVPPAQHRIAPSFAERVAYQRAIEEVYWRHRIWPKERPDPKPSLDAVMSSAQVEKKAQDYLRNSRVLEDYWHQPITSQQLQTEMERMAQHTQNPEMLAELFEALGNDPFVIAECLARPALSERLVNEFYEMNPKPGSEPMQRGQSSLQSQGANGESDAATGPPVFTGYSLPALTSPASACTDDTWSSLAALPARRANHTAVWTGSEMIVFGGLNYGHSLGTGDRYNPATDSWSKVSLTHAPGVRNNHTAVWTGTEMIVWGGYNQIGTGAIYLNSGGKYNPANNSWVPTSLSNAPTARALHTAVWTGNRMIVWGGVDTTGLPNTGGRYDPITDSWQPISTTNAPEGRYQHSVVWAGTAMIIWGGRNCDDCYLNSGAKYNPGSNTWTTISTINAPAARFGQSAVWTGSQMIIWGGWNGTALSNGAKYNPTANTWITLTAINPPQARFLHSAVWTGGEMIVWGGDGYPSPFLNSGSRYNPAANTWSPMSVINAPSSRDTHTTIWTGSEMIVFGGGYGETLSTGGRYDPAADTWTPVRTTNTPDGVVDHTAVWTGSEMIVWGGFNENQYISTNSGGRYDPSLDTWVPTSTVNAPDGRFDHTAVWTGTEMIVWGGWYTDGFTLHVWNTGGRYNPATDNWTPTTLINAPDAKRWHSAVWTGSEMIVWGGTSGLGGSDDTNTGARYNPDTDTWIATSVANAPTPRQYQKAVWTGTEMIVWGGTNYAMDFNTGGRYHPSTDTWTATSITNAPTGRENHAVVWTGTEMIVWGGVGDSTGGRYHPSTNSWTATSLLNAPDARTGPVAVWTGNEMIVWGGGDFITSETTNTGGRYNPTTDSWTATRTINAPHVAGSSTAVWTGSRMIVWGGVFQFYDPFGHYFSYTLSTGGRYCAVPPVVTTKPATNVAAYSATLNGSVNPRGLTTTVHFQYGTTTSYGLNTANQSYTGSTYQNVSANISGLSASTPYHFRIVGINSSGTYYGADRILTTLSATGPPVVTTNPATLIAGFSGTLNGSVDPHGLTTTVHFEYGTTTSYGSTTASQNKTGNTYQSVSANISGLTASTTYHFRIVATNSSGTRHGADRTFTTLSATGPPVMITNPATSVTNSSATLNGTVDPHGLNTSVHFQYGTTTSYGSTTAPQTKTGNTYQSVSANISGLSASTTYHFRMVATNSAGTTYGGDRAFTTP